MLQHRQPLGRLTCVRAISRTLRASLVLLAISLLGSTWALAHPGQDSDSPGYMERVRAIVGEHLQSTALAEELEPLVEEVMASFPKATEPAEQAELEYAFLLATTALAWGESFSEGGVPTPAMDRLRAIANSQNPSARRNLVLGGPHALLEVARLKPDRDAAVSIAEWFESKFSPTPTERLGMIQLLAEIEFQAGNPDQADQYMDEFQAVLAEIENADGLPSIEDYLSYHRFRFACTRAQRWIYLGVVDQAVIYAQEAMKLSAGLRIEERSRAVDTLASIFLASLRPEAALAALDQFLERENVVQEAISRQVQLRRGMALDVLAIQGERPMSEARAIFEELVQSPRQDGLRARALLELADIVLHEDLADKALAESRRERLEQRARELLVDARNLIGPADRLSDLQPRMLAWQDARLALLVGDEREVMLRAADRLELAIDASLGDHQRRSPRRGGTGFLHLVYPREFLVTWVQIQLALYGDWEGAQRSLRKIMSIQAQGRLAQDLRVQAPAIDVLLSELGSENQGVLLYLPGIYSTALFIADSQGVRVEFLESLHELHSQRQSFVAELGARPRDIASGAEGLLARLNRDGEQLADYLLPEVVRNAMRSWKQVTIVGGDLFQGVPFECLPMQAEDGRIPLGLVIGVQNSPSLPLIRYLAKTQDRDYRHDLVVGVTLLDAGSEVAANRYQVSDKEEKRIANRLARSFQEVRTFHSEQVTWSAIQKTAQDPVAVIHLLAHGAYDRTRERGACLVLSSGRSSESDLVYSERIESSDLKAGLVILSACGTARGPLRLGDDNLQHLGGAFLRAGVGGVILTQADVALEEAMILQEVVHQRLRAGDAPAEALRRGRVAVAERYGALAGLLAGRYQLYGSGSVPLF